MDRISQLLYKKITGTLNADENAELEAWANTPERRQLLDKMSDSEAICRKYQRRNLINTDTPCADMQRRIAAAERPHIIRRRAFAAAASVAILLMASSIYFFSRNNNLKQPDTIITAQTESIRHGETKATLHTSNGNTLILNSQNSGQETSELITTDNTDSQKIEHLCLDVPRGGEFKIMLEDSTEVWLNSESQLRYPEVFAANERRVQVSGEVYFKVKPDQNRPFYVESAGQVIRVYGTSFNVKSYNDENMTYTTLETGSVSLTQASGDGGELYLSPGHQACFNHDSQNIDMKVVDPEVIASWRHGKFVFEEQPLKNIMRDLSRWYNFEYEFTDPEVAEYVFMGSIPRYANFHTATVILEKSGDLSITTEGNKVTISKRTK